jgi:hypothetical protein
MGVMILAQNNGPPRFLASDTKLCNVASGISIAWAAFATDDELNARRIASCLNSFV